MMKMLLISNGYLAESLAESLKNYFSTPDIDTICFNYPDHKKALAILEDYLTECLAANPAEQFIICCDDFGTTAFNEAAVLLEQKQLSRQAVIICGMSLPMLLKLYGLKDCVSLELCRKLYEEDTYTASDLMLRSAV